MEVTISERFGKTFQLEKPPCPLSLPLEALLPGAPEEPTNASSGADAEKNTALLRALGYPRSSRAAKPWLPEIPESPVARFYLDVPETLPVARWELRILDAEGRLVSLQRFSGRPPKGAVEWDGKTSAGRTAQVGRPYAYRIELFNDRGRVQSRTGRSFELPALQYRVGERRVIEISLDRLFMARRASLSREGTEWLSRALETLAENNRSRLNLTLRDPAPQKLLQKRLKELETFVLAQTQALPEDVAFQVAPPSERGRVLEIDMPEAK